MDTAKDRTKDMTKDTTKDSAKDTAKDTTNDTDKETTKDMTRDMTKDTAKDTEKDIDKVKDKVKGPVKDTVKDKVKEPEKDMVKGKDTDMEMKMNMTSSDCSPHWQWRVPKDNITFMLNADVALFKDIKVNEAGKSSCTFKECSDSPTAGVVRAFAQSNKVWMAAFEKVFAKMLAHGSNTLYDLQ